MKKEFEKHYFSLRTKTVLSSIIVTAIVLTNNVIVKAIDVNNVTTNLSNTVKITDEHRLITDEPIELYNDLWKIESILNFKIKLPEYLPEEYKLGGFELKSISEKDKCIEIFYEKAGESFSFQVSEEDPAETLKIIETEQSKTIKDLKIDSEKYPSKLGEINGLNIILTTTFPESKKISSYFAWKDKDLYYSIEYNSIVQSEEKSTQLVSMSQDTVEKIAKSIKYT